MRLGVVGTSWITDSFLEAIKDIPDITLVSVTSPRKESTERFIKKYGFLEGYNDYNQMIYSTKVDLLYIASPNSFHFLQTKKALSCGINVLCEKPITLSELELDILKNIAVLNNVYFIEAMRPVHHPHTQFLKESLNKLDSIKYANLKFMRYSSKYDAYKQGLNPRVFTKDFGGGALNDLGVYPITLAVLLFGAPKEVKKHSLMLNTGVDATTSVILQYEDFICTCSFSKISNSYSYNEIQGEANTILLSHVTHLDKMILKDDEKEEVLLDKQIDDDMKYEMKAIMNIIKNNDKQEFDRLFNITKTVTRICDKIRK